MSLVVDTPGARVWKGESWEVREGRWQGSPPEVVDHVISDPPFDERTSNGQRRGIGHRAGCAAREISFEGVTPFRVAPGMLDVARRWVVVFCAVEQIGDYSRAAGDRRWVRAAAWVKTNPPPQFSGDRPATWGEAIAIMHRPGRKWWNGGGKAGLYVGPSAHGTNTTSLRVHETQKPLALMRALVEDFTDPGELVWDPFGGSMTTGVACLQLGRRFLGHEMQARYCDVGVERLEAAERGQTLREYRAGQEVLDL